MQSSKIQTSSVRTAERRPAESGATVQDLKEGTKTIVCSLGGGGGGGEA